MNNTENRKKRVKIIKNTKDRFRVVWCTEVGQNIVWSITDVSSPYNMTAMNYIPQYLLIVIAIYYLVGFGACLHKYVFKLVNQRWAKISAQLVASCFLYIISDTIWRVFSSSDPSIWT